MVFKDISIGSKKPKKEITINVTFGHIVLFFLFLMFVSYLVILAVSKLGLTDYNQEIQCTNGKTEKIEFNKTIYCGEHYSVLKNTSSEKTYKLMEDTIYGRTQ